MAKRSSSGKLLSRLERHTGPSLVHAKTSAEERRSEVRFHDLVAATTDAIYEMSPDWTVMHRLEGRKVLGPVVMPDPNWLAHYIPDEDRPLVWAAIEHAIRTKSNFELEHRVRRFDGSIGWILSHAVPMFDEQGQLVTWLGAAIDTTERKAAGEALLRNERLASLGRMAATISHEINNPL
ncbi:MAG TPA: PAS domain-containing protein, partial [Terracidiphilus sp.]|nr:PAS domain-containing protein [Terracidiphilus sp.]